MNDKQYALALAQDTQSPSPAFAPPSWNPGARMHREHMDWLAAADETSVTPALQEVVRRGIALMRAELVRKHGVPGCGQQDITPLHLSSVAVRASSETVALLKAMVSTGGGKYRDQRPYIEQWAVDLGQAGSLVRQEWPTGDDGCLHYAAWRHTLLNVSYRDNIPYHRLPSSLWTCEPSTQIPGYGRPLPTVSVLGRRWVLVGTSSLGRYREATAWGIAPAGDWGGRICDYPELLEEWSGGTTERGDMRGCRVESGPYLGVLAQAAVFYDPMS